MTVRPAARFLVLAAAVVGFAVFAACAARSADAPPPTTTSGQPMIQGGTAGPGAAPGGDPVARGKFLSELLGCVGCHTPHDADGKPDLNYLMAGHRAADPAPTWSDSMWDRGAGMVVSTAGTAYAGPWGVTFARNLTPDKTTGIGAWTEESFIYILREGTLKPPMPSVLYGNLSDDDLKAIFAYLKSLAPVKNLVPFRQLSPPRLPGETPGTKRK